MRALPIDALLPELVAALTSGRAAVSGAGGRASGATAFSGAGGRASGATAFSGAGGRASGATAFSGAGGRASGATAVVEAEPGAGKTTRVPLHLARCLRGEVVVAEPRRLAARLAARHVAEELGERPGETVGYSVRFEDVSGPRTRVRYVTLGVLLRRLLAEPTLPGVGAVILDEFHERQLDADLLLLLLRQLQRGPRPDLRLVVMSATLQAEPLVRYLDGCVRLSSAGRLFPIEIEHAREPDTRPLALQVVGAVRATLREGPPGDVLVFLPGSGDIRRSAEALGPLAAEHALDLLPLHGELPLAEQARAVGPSSRRKVVLSTNVAESSVTIDGVTTVIDSGLSRQASSSPWSGLPVLTVDRISRASAVQRAGRAGRTAPGRVRRLYTAGDFASRRESDPPEVLRADLSETLLLLHGAGIPDPTGVEWLDPPPPAALAAAQALLGRLNALAPGGGLSATGRRMLALPLPPRLARLVVAGEDLGVGEEAALAAALLGERDLRLSQRAFGDERRGGRREAEVSGPSDVAALMDAFAIADAARFDERRLRAEGIDARSARAAGQAFRQLRRLVGRGPSPPALGSSPAGRAEAASPGGWSGAEARAPAAEDDADDRLTRALLAAFPDRVALRRRAGERELTLATGATARLSEQSGVHDGRFLLAVAVDDQDPQNRGRATVRLACQLDPEWLLAREDDLTFTDELVLHPELGRVESLSRVAYGAVVLEESRAPARPSAEVSRLLVRALTERGVPEALEGVLARIAFLAREVPDAGFPLDARERLPELLASAAGGCTRLSELEGADLVGTLLDGGAGLRRALDELAPERLELPGGRRVPIHYEADRPPWVESRLQDFFGMGEVPRIARGRVALTVHLLAPNQRAVQVTSDLAGFWERHYPGIRRELMRRYPRHSWPEDGRTATPPEPRGRGRG